MPKNILSKINLEIIAIAILSSAILWLLLNQYRGTNSQGEAIVGEIKNGAAISILHDQIKRAKNIEEWKKAFRTFDASGNKHNNELMERVKSIFLPLQEHHTNKPREIEDKNILQQKREYLELIQAKFRRDKNDISISTLLASMIQESQRSLWQDGLDADLIFVKKAKEKVSALKVVSKNRTDLPKLEEVIEKLEVNTAAAKSWQMRKDELQLAADKQVALLTDASKKSADENLEESQAYFLKSLIVALFSLLLSVALFFYSQQKKNLARKKEIAAMHLLAKGVSKDFNHSGLSSDWFNVAQKVVQLHDAELISNSQLNAWAQLPIWAFVADASGKVVFRSNQLNADFSECETIFDLFQKNNFLQSQRILQDLKDRSSGIIYSELNFNGTATAVEIAWSTISASGAYNGTTIIAIQRRSDDEGAMQNAIAEVLRPIYEPEYSGKVHALVQPALDKFHDFHRRESEQQLYFKAEMNGLRDQLERALEFREKESTIAASFRGSADDLHRKMEQFSKDEINHLNDLHKLGSDLVSASKIVSEIEGFIHSYRAINETHAKLLRKLRSEHSAIQEAFSLAQEDLEKIKFNIEEAKLQGINYSLSGTESPGAIKNYRNAIQLTQNAIEKFEAVMHTLRNFITRSVVNSDALQEASSEELPSISVAHQSLRQIEHYLQKWHALSLKKQTNSVAAKESARVLLTSSQELQEWTKRGDELNHRLVSRLSNWN